ncbi:MAG: DUF397 domain-containing protein [Pseudonocardiaceae bacterium]
MTSSLAARDVPSQQEKEYGMVEVPPPPATASWQKSSATGSQNCLEVTRAHEHVWLRDSKNPLGPVLGFNSEGWAAFVVGVQRDEFDRSGVPV